MYIELLEIRVGGAVATTDLIHLNPTSPKYAMVLKPESEQLPTQPSSEKPFPTGNHPTRSDTYPSSDSFTLYIHELRFIHGGVKVCMVVGSYNIYIDSSVSIMQPSMLFLKLS